MSEKMRSIITSAFEVVGMTLISYGAFEVYPPAGWIVTGTFFILIGALTA